jgi:hypothetical protein
MPVYERFFDENEYVQNPLKNKMKMLYSQGNSVLSNVREMEVSYNNAMWSDSWLNSNIDYHNESFHEIDVGASFISTPQIHGYILMYFMANER